MTDQKMIFAEMVHDVLQRLAFAEVYTGYIVNAMLVGNGEAERVTGLLQEYRLVQQVIIEDMTRLVPTACPALPAELPEWLWLSPEPELLIAEYLEKIDRVAARMNKTLRMLEEGLCQ